MVAVGGSALLAFAVSVLKAPAAISRQGLRLGPVRLTAYGACAALGVIGAMALSARTARRSGLGDVAWDAGFLAILSCFIASRLLLVLSDPVAFARYPLLVLSLPSLTIAGIALAAAITGVHLRRKRRPILKLLDVFSPGGALLAALLELGHGIEGTDIGMPRFRGYNNTLTGFVPVAWYGVILSLLLALLLRIFSAKQNKSGRVAALGLILGGISAFGLDLLSLPSDFFDGLWLEPGQIVALGAMLAGALLWVFGPNDQQQSASEPERTAHRLRGQNDAVIAPQGEVR